MPNHVHMMMSVPPKYAVSQVVGLIKLVTCALCKEAVAENRARVRDGQQVCIPCSGYGG